MTRRVIATAEVQVASDVAQAEAGLNGLTESFRVIGAQAERAAERAEAAFFGTARSMKGGFKQIVAASEDLLDSMEQGDRVAKQMAASLRQSLAAVQRMSNEDMDSKAVAALRTFRQIAGTAEAIDRGLHDAKANAARVAAEAAKIARETKEAEERAEALRHAFRDVGREVELVMSGGVDGLENDIRDVIRRLDDMEGEFRDVGRIGEAALDGIMDEFDEDVDAAVNSLFRLERQLRSVAEVGDNALEGLDDDARQAARALDNMADQARRADRALDGISSVTRRTSSDVRGLITLLGVGGLGYAFTQTARFGLDMTRQLEKSEATFLGLTGSVEGAADMLERMVEFARDTPYNLANVTESAAQLLAVGDGFGVTTENIDEYLTAFGNAITITGGSDEQFIRIVRVLGQMSSTGKVLGQDMNQLAQNLPGYDVWQTLADGAGTSVKELRRLQDLGQLDELLTGNEAVEILVDGMNEIPGAAGAMERRMNTLGGAIEKFTETAQLAMSEGMEPFSKTAQDTLTNPVILNSVEDLSFAFGDLLSSGLEEIAPELDDLAAAGENLLNALQSWAPVAETAVDALGDLMQAIAPIVDAAGRAASAVLDFGGGLGKLGVAAGLFAVGGPIGIAGGVLLGVSGAMDLVAGDMERASNMARLLAAAQGEVNDAMSETEEVAYSTAQQLAINTAESLREDYGELANAMASFGVTVTDLQDGMVALAEGTGEVPVALQEMLNYFNDPNIDGGKIIDQFDQITEAYKEETDVLTEETKKQDDILKLAGVERIAELEARAEAERAHADAIAEYWEEYGERYAEAMDAAADTTHEWGELTEEQTETVVGLLQDQVSAYIDWEDEINNSTEDAKLSLAGLAGAVENDVDAMIQSINEHSIEIAQWKSNIVEAASQLADGLGVPDEAAQEFMATLGEMGPEFAPALAEMLADAENGGTQLEDFFNAVSTNSEVMSSSLTDAFDEATGSVPDLAESLAEGTLTIEDVLTALPDAMESAGLDFEAAAAAIDASDELGVVGNEAVNGLVNALNAGTSRVRTAAARLAAAADEGARAKLEVRSPSRVMYEVGEFAAEGLIGGLQSLSDEAYAVSAQVASMMTGGIADHFRDADDPQEEARKFAEDVAESIIDELIAEQEAVADAAQELAEAAADRLSEVWDRIKARFEARDLKESIEEAKADLAEAQADLASAVSLSGAEGARAQAAAEQRVAAARRALAQAEAADAQADILADSTLTDFRRQTEDLAADIADTQAAEVAAIQQRISDAIRNLDPTGRAAAEAELEAAQARHEAEMTAFDRRREDEELALQRRLDNEDLVREAAIAAKESELSAFENALDDIVDSIADAIENLPGLRDDVSDARRDVQEAYLDQFESMLENLSRGTAGAARSIGLQSGLSASEVDALIAATLAASDAERRAADQAAGVDALLGVLSTGLYTIGANGSLGIAAGLDAEARAIAESMRNALQSAVTAALNEMEIRSPSRVTADLIGRPMAEGIAAGLTSSIPDVGYAMAGLLDNVIGEGVPVPSASQLVDNGNTSTTVQQPFTGPLVSMPGAVIQDATDADLVAQRVVVALSATGVS